MKQGFPQFAPSAKLGDLGISIVSRVANEDFGWLFKRNHQEHDFGIDGQIEIISDEGAVTGQMLACQVKCGKSFLKETNKWGCVYRGETKHFNYLANYPIPVVIIICNPESREAYWARFEATAVRLTGSGWALTIPFANKLASSKDALLSLLPEPRDMLSELQDYWTFNNMLSGFSTIVLMTDVKDIRIRDISWIVSFFNRLRSSRELAYECQGKIEFGFYGYDDDPRELFEIDEVRHYVALIDAALPELFFFARSDEAAVTLPLFVFCLMGIEWETERSTPGVPRRVVVDLEPLHGFLERHYEGLNSMSEWVGLSEEDIERISRAAVKMLGYMPGSDDESQPSAAST